MESPGHYDFSSPIKSINLQQTTSEKTEKKSPSSLQGPALAQIKALQKVASGAPISASQTPLPQSAKVSEVAAQHLTGASEITRYKQAYIEGMTRCVSLEAYKVEKAKNESAVAKINLQAAKRSDPNILKLSETFIKSETNYNHALLEFETAKKNNTLTTLEKIDPNIKQWKSDLDGGKIPKNTPLEMYSISKVWIQEIHNGKIPDNTSLETYAVDKAQQKVDQLISEIKSSDPTSSDYESLMDQLDQANADLDSAKVHYEKTVKTPTFINDATYRISNFRAPVMGDVVKGKPIPFSLDNHGVRCIKLIEDLSYAKPKMIIEHAKYLTDKFNEGVKKNYGNHPPLIDRSAVEFLAFMVAFKYSEESRVLNTDFSKIFPKAFADRKLKTFNAMEQQFLRILDNKIAFEPINQWQYARELYDTGIKDEGLAAPEMTLEAFQKIRVKESYEQSQQQTAKVEQELNDFHQRIENYTNLKKTINNEKSKEVPNEEKITALEDELISFLERYQGMNNELNATQFDIYDDAAIQPTEALRDISNKYIESYRQVLEKEIDIMDEFNRLSPLTNTYYKGNPPTVQVEPLNDTTDLENEKTELTDLIQQHEEELEKLKEADNDPTNVHLYDTNEAKEIKVKLMDLMKQQKEKSSIDKGRELILSEQTIVAKTMLENTRKFNAMRLKANLIIANKRLDKVETELRKGKTV